MLVGLGPADAALELEEAEPGPSPERGEGSPAAEEEEEEREGEPERCIHYFADGALRDEDDAPRAGRGVYFNRQVVARTPMGRWVELLTLTEAPSGSTTIIIIIIIITITCVLSLLVFL